MTLAYIQQVYSCVKVKGLLGCGQGRVQEKAALGVGEGRCGRVGKYTVTGGAVWLRRAGVLVC